MGASSVRDLIIKGDDLCVATHGRGFWILDNITPLRQLEVSVTKAPAVLFRPQVALRVRWNLNTDTPLPPDVPAGENPPDGAMIDYYIGAGSSGPVSLEIKDETGQVVRRYSSADPLPTPNPSLAIPSYWLRPPQKLAADPGMHRFLWDLRYAPVPGEPTQYPIAAVYRNTAPVATSPWVMPGKYSVVLTVGGKSYEQPLTVVMDPRVKTSHADLLEQFRLSKSLYDEWRKLDSISLSLRRVREQITELQTRVPAGDLKAHITALAEKLQSFSTPGGPGGGGVTAGVGPRTLVGASGRIRTLFNVIQNVDVAPTSQVVAAVPGLLEDSRAVQESWQAIKSQAILPLNLELRAAGRNFSESEQEQFRAIQKQALRWTYLGSAMTHPQFLQTDSEINPDARTQIEEMSKAFC
jgi:hypothetical protein